MSKKQTEIQQTLPANLDLRPSKVPGFCQCPGFAVVADKPYRIIASDEDMKPATLGTALHAVFRDYITQNKATNAQNLAPYIEKYNVPYEGYMGLRRKAMVMEQNWGKHMAQFFNKPYREREVGYKIEGERVLKGTPDLFQLMGEYAMVLDLKTGEVDLDHMKQLETYALILFRLYENTGLQEVYCYQWNPVLESYNGVKFTAKQLEEFEKFLMSQATKITNKYPDVCLEYKIGVWCGYCENVEVCPAHRRAFMQVEQMVPKITVEQISTVRPIIKAMGKIIKMYEDTEKALLTKYGTINLGNGYMLAYNDRHDRGYDVPATIRILSKDFGVPTDVIAKHLSIKSSSIDAIAKEIAPQGGKGKKIKEVKEHLEKNDAVFEKITKVRTLRRISTQEE